MNEFTIMDLMDEIEYGWIDKDRKKHIDDFETFSDEYILQSPNEIIRSKIGVCWDQVELERYYFSDVNKSIKTFFIVYYDNNKCPTHTFLTFKKDNKYYWFEHSWEKFRGIHEYYSMRELLLDVRNKFIEFQLDNRYNKENLVINEYSKPEFNISVQEFYNHCENGELIKIDKIKE